MVPLSAVVRACNTGHNHPVTVEGSTRSSLLSGRAGGNTGHNHPVTVEG